MAIFKQGDNICYFIHIPRTGGRYVSSLFENSEDIECKHHKIHTEEIRGIDITHLHYPLYDHFLRVENIPHIAVVRNPYSKFYSSIRNMHSLHQINYNELLCNEQEFLKFINIEIEIQSFHNNWFLPQHKFLSPKTHVWKYEWGFGDKFKKWVYDKTQIELTIQKVDYDNFKGETSEQFKIDKRIKKYVKNFYRKDYNQFGYFL
jgi:hypothetical protein